MIPRIYLERFFPVVLALAGGSIMMSYEWNKSREGPVRVRNLMANYIICDFVTTNREALSVVWHTNYTGTGIVYRGVLTTNDNWRR